MRTKRTVSLAVAITCFTVMAAMPAAQAQQIANAPTSLLVTNGPQSNPGDYSGWSTQRNIAESHQYDRLLRTNRAFRQARMQKECGPVTDPALHASCMQSFAQDEPFKLR